MIDPYILVPDSSSITILPPDDERYSAIEVLRRFLGVTAELDDLEVVMEAINIMTGNL